MIPIGRGQRELIIGDRQTGKTAIALDTILNPTRPKCCMCLCCYWSKSFFCCSSSNYFEEKGALDYTIVVAANADSPATLQYIAPYTGAALAEYFMYTGKQL